MGVEFGGRILTAALSLALLAASEAAAAVLKETPSLAAAVSAGQLPAIADRLPALEHEGRHPAPLPPPRIIAGADGCHGVPL